MKKFRLLSLVLSLVMIVSMVAGCGKKGADEKTENGKKTESVENGKADEKTKTDKGEKLSYSDMPTSLTADKVSSTDAYYIYSASKHGIIYRNEDGTYGIMTLDGQSDSAAKYTACKPSGKYFQVTTAKADSVESVDAMNCFGLVDAAGKEIIPMEYASISELNERYFKVIEVTEQTSDKEEALLYSTDRAFSLSAEDGDNLYKGKWYIYDVIEGKKVEGISATNAYATSAFGKFIEYVTDEKEKITVDANGENLPEEAKLLSNGYYYVEADGKGIVYDSDRNKAFEYDTDGFTPSSLEDEYILASKYENDTRTYVLMDLSGEVVSAEFNEFPYVYGDLIKVSEKVYNFDGELVNDATFKNVYLETNLNNVWLLKNDKNYSMIKKDGTVLYEGVEDDEIYFDTSNFCIRKKVEDKNKYYSFADKDFTIEGTAIAPWIVKTAGSDGLYNIVDTISGKTIIKGYKNYTATSSPGSGIYVYASKDDGGMDVYKVK